MKAKEIEKEVLKYIKRGEFNCSISLLKSYFNFPHTTKTVNPKLLGYAYEIKEAYKHKKIADEHYLKGKPYFYFALPHYKKCLLTYMVHEPENLRELLERYKHVKRNCKTPKFLYQFDEISIGIDHLIGKTNKKCAIYTLNGKKLSKDYEGISNVTDLSYFIVRNKDKFGVINTSGEEVLPLKYPEIVSFKEGIAVIKVANGKQFVFWNDSNRISQVYDDVTNFSEGIAGAKRSNMWSFIDSKLYHISESKFESILEFKQNLCGVKQYGMWGFINPQGEFTIKPLYKSVNSFDSYQLGLVMINNTQYSINKKGVLLGKNDYFNR